eukprot:scaffold57769_cov32-Tisochrysis_lutea.AAC.4
MLHRDVHTCAGKRAKLPPMQKSITTVAMQKAILLLAKYWYESMVAACRIVSGMKVFLKPTTSDMAPKKNRPAALPRMADSEPEAKTVWAWRELDVRAATLWRARGWARQGCCWMACGRGTKRAGRVAHRRGRGRRPSLAVAA